MSDMIFIRLALLFLVLQSIISKLGEIVSLYVILETVKSIWSQFQSGSVMAPMRKGKHVEKSLSQSQSQSQSSTRSINEEVSRDVSEITLALKELQAADAQVRQATKRQTAAVRRHKAAVAAAEKNKRKRSPVRKPITSMKPRHSGKTQQSFQSSAEEKPPAHYYKKIKSKKSNNKKNNSSMSIWSHLSVTDYVMFQKLQKQSERLIQIFIIYHQPIRKGSDTNTPNLVANIRAVQQATWIHKHLGAFETNYHTYIFIMNQQILKFAIILQGLIQHCLTDNSQEVSTSFSMSN